MMSPESLEVEVIWASEWTARLYTLPSKLLSQDINIMARAPPISQVIFREEGIGALFLTLLCFLFLHISFQNVVLFP